MVLILKMLATVLCHAAVIYQGATASLSSTPSLVTYTVKMPLLATPQVVLTSSVEDPTPRAVDIAPAPQDNDYLNGIYNCPTRGTFSVGASITLTGTLSVGNAITLNIDLSKDGGATWSTLRSVTAAVNTGVPKGSNYNAFLVPCPEGGKIRVMAATNVILPVISSVPAESTLSITKIF